MAKTVGFLRRFCLNKKSDVRIPSQFGLLECKSPLVDFARADIERLRHETGSVHNIGEGKEARASITRPAMPEADNGNTSDVFERIAQTLPPEQREEYWREIVHLKHLDPNDELLRLARAIGYLAQITQSVPTLIAEERQRFETLLDERAAAIEHAWQATQAYQRELDQRLSKLPETIAEGVQPIAADLDSEAMAKAITENIQRQLAEAGLHDTSQLLRSVGKQLKELSSELDQAIKPPHKRYSNIAVSIEGELLKLDQASARLREHAAKLAAQTRQDRWFWKTVYYLVFFAVGLVAGIAWEKTNAASLMFDLQGQVAQLQQTIKSPPSPTNSNSPALTLRQKKGGGVAVANR